MEKNESESLYKIYVNFDRTDCKSDNVLSAISFIIVTIVIFLSKNGARILKEKKHDCQCSIYAIVVFFSKMSILKLGKSGYF